ncbi:MULTISPECIES: YeiH family protein [Pontibacillus]|uniref:Sulfate exporter family transporter n=1 Tax=Pontibacillus chungwhensis TaxID=265426 RepID=A0ABY8V5F8_9BACI|nr:MULTISPECIES: putative sulfate exporter family transporter [Pontibacillus]MCD5325249.1 putative sulfate exporter family transporter [Pontibacillus sp. HN14]WIG00247.1 putative sulfate exporter family transporter [Pontibacillus chungwhensis]
MLGGVLFTFFIAVLGYGLSELRGFSLVGPLACSILIAIACRQIWDYPEHLRVGIEFSAKKLLRLAIILYGLKLNIGVIMSEGLPLLLRGTATIVFAIALTLLIAKWIKADMTVALLLGVGTGVCGAAAIAAVSPIIKSKEEDTAIGVGMIALAGTIFAILYTLVRPLLPISMTDYGVWAGISLHEIAHVALAGAPAGEEGLAMALLSKLGRVFLLVPLCFLLMFWMKKKGSSQSSEDSNVPFPWFLIGFIGMSLFGSFIVGEYITLSEKVIAFIGNATTFILTMAMVGLGLNVSFKSIRTRALRPLIAMLITSVLLSILTYFTL